jgi:hypothetical protein
MDRVRSVFSNEEVCIEVKRNEEHRLFDYKEAKSWDEKSRDAVELV